MSVLLKKPVFEGISQKELAQQLEGKKRCKKKLPTWFKTPRIYYPKKLNIEQSSSELAASYKSEIIHGKRLLDLTGGLGADSYFFSKEVKEVYYCEIDGQLSKIAAHNFKVLGVDNIKVCSEDGISFLKNTNLKFDWIYLDPSRRHNTKGRVFRLSDYDPNILEHIDLLFDKSENILLKTSPLLDLSAGAKELGCVSEIHVVAINNEVKELLWKLEKGFSSPAVIKAINFKGKKSETFEFIPDEERAAKSIFSEPLKYLYEPNSSILKAGAFKLTGERFSLSKLHEHSHLYTSEELHEFPGRIFAIDGAHKYSKRTVKSLNIKRCNISVRNFPHSVESIRKMFKLGSGGETYLFFTKTDKGHLAVLNCRKVERRLGHI